jgi:hypothetical protein
MRGIVIHVYRCVLYSSFCTSAYDTVRAVLMMSELIQQHSGQLGINDQQADILYFAQVPEGMAITRAGWLFRRTYTRYIWVNGNWRITFRFDGENAELVDYQD